MRPTERYQKQLPGQHEAGSTRPNYRCAVSICKYLCHKIKPVSEMKLTALYSSSDANLSFWILVM